MFYKFQIKYIFTKKNSNEKNLHLVIKKTGEFFFVLSFFKFKSLVNTYHFCRSQRLIIIHPNLKNKKKFFFVFSNHDQLKITNCSLKYWLVTAIKLAAVTEMIGYDNLAFNQIMDYIIQKIFVNQMVGQTVGQSGQSNGRSNGRSEVLTNRYRLGHDWL